MKAFIIPIIAILLSGCTNQGVPVSISGAVDTGFHVEKLFEIDGISVYRFEDAGRYVYFTNTTGQVEYSYSIPSGKTSVRKKMQTLCNGLSEEKEGGRL